MWTIRIKDRGRDLVIHHTESWEDAAELQRVYLALGYPEEKILVLWEEAVEQEAA